MVHGGASLRPDAGQDRQRLAWLEQFAVFVRGSSFDRRVALRYGRKGPRIATSPAVADNALGDREPPGTVGVRRATLLRRCWWSTSDDSPRCIMHAAARDRGVWVGWSCSRCHRAQRGAQPERGQCSAAHGQRCVRSANWRAAGLLAGIASPARVEPAPRSIVGGLTSPRPGDEGVGSCRR